MANLIAEIEAMGQQKKGENVALVVKLKESNGMSFDWTSWHINAFKDYSIGDVVEIVPELKPNPKSKYPYRNIGSIVGKRTTADINSLDVTSGEVGGSKPSTSASPNGGGRYSSPEAQVYERRSIERQGSVGRVAAFLAPMSLDELETNADKILAIATKFEAHIQRDGGLVWPQPQGQPTRPIKPPAATPNDQSKQTNGSKPQTDYGDKVPETVLELLNMAIKRFGKNKHEVCMVFSIPDEEWEDIPARAGSLTEAWESLVNMWSGPSE